MIYPVIIIVLLALIISSAIKVIYEYERGVVFRLGRFSGVKGPGLRFIIPVVDRLMKISLRTVAMDVPPQDVITPRITFRSRSMRSFISVSFIRKNRLSRWKITFTPPVNWLKPHCVAFWGQSELDELLAHRDSINRHLQEILDRQTDPWGVKVSNVEIKHVDLPVEMQRAMARQAEAERERRSKVIHAEGEYQAAQKLTDCRLENYRIATGCPAVALSADFDRSCDGKTVRQ